MRVSTRGLTAVLGCLAIGCGDGAGKALDSDEHAVVAADATPPWLSISAPLEAGSTCAHGGQRTDMGMDLDASGTLEASEVRSTSVVCSALADSTSSAPISASGSGSAPNTAENNAPDPCAGASAGAPLALESLHASVNGPGYFALGTGAVDSVRYYTRTVEFYASEDGELTNQNHLHVLGYQGSRDGTFSNILGPLSVGSGSLSATATEVVKLSVNLNATADIAAPWNPSNPADTSNFATSSALYDSLGNRHLTTVYFAKSTTNTWAYHAMVDGKEVTEGTPDVPFEGASGTLEFTADGALDLESTGTSTWDFTGATPGQVVQFDFGTSIRGEGGKGLDGTVNFASNFTTNGLSQDGYAAGALAGLTLTELGVIAATYTNGQQQLIGQLVLARFPINSGGLAQLCNGMWTDATVRSDATFDLAGTPGRGLISAGNAH